MRLNTRGSLSAVGVVMFGLVALGLEGEDGPGWGRERSPVSRGAVERPAT